jgi:hypothetical protein
VLRLKMGARLIETRMGDRLVDDVEELTLPHERAGSS